MPVNLQKCFDQFSNEEENQEFTHKPSRNGKNEIGDYKLLTAEKKIIISNLIKEDNGLWMNILNFKKVDFKKIKDLVVKKGLIIENKVLKEYLKELGVICSLD